MVIQLLNFSFYRNQANIIINMTSQQMKTQYHSFISERRCSAPLSNPSSMLLPSSPNLQRVQNVNPFFESNYNCLSPSLRNQASNSTLFTSPQKCLTMKEITEEKINYMRCSDKGRRATLPILRLESLDDSQRYLSISPQKPPKAQIKFTYQNKLDSIQKQSFKPSCEDQRVFLVKQKSEKLSSHSKISQYKISKNKLCSTVFSCFHSPLSSIRRKSQQLDKLLKQLRRKADLLSCRVISSCEFSKDCKTSGAQTSTSAMLGVKQSEMSIYSSRWSCSQSDTKSNFQGGFNLARPSLADQIPSSKQLGKTIILNSTSYDFGGIMMPSSQQAGQPVIKPQLGQGLTRDWDQLKGLLGQDNKQSMKQSIHCGPDVRASNFNCEMLKNFGRSIKESSLSYHE